MDGLVFAGEELKLPASEEAYLHDQKDGSRRLDQGVHDADEGQVSPDGEELPEGWIARKVGTRVQYSNERLRRVQFFPPKAASALSIPHTADGPVGENQGSGSSAGRAQESQETQNSTAAAAAVATGASASGAAGKLRDAIGATASSTAFSVSAAVVGGKKGAFGGRIPDANAGAVGGADVFGQGRGQWANDLLKNRTRMVVGSDGELVPVQEESGEDGRKEGGAGGEDKGIDRGRLERDLKETLMSQKVGVGAGSPEDMAGGDREGEGEGEDEEELDPEGLNGRSGMRNVDYRLWRACENGEVDAVRECLDIGASPNAYHPGVFKWTSMHLAAINDQAPTLELLHEHGADLLQRDASGRTPLRIARKHLKLEAVAALEAMMGYGDGEGSDTSVELGDDLPLDIKQHLAGGAGGVGGSGHPEELPQDYQHPFWSQLEKNATLASEAKAERAIREFNATEYEEWLRKKEENKKASVRRREAACELETEEQTDTDGCVRIDSELSYGRVQSVQQGCNIQICMQIRVPLKVECARPSAFACVLLCVCTHACPCV